MQKYTEKELKEKIQPNTLFQQQFFKIGQKILKYVYVISVHDNGMYVEYLPSCEKDFISWKSLSTTRVNFDITLEQARKMHYAGHS